MVQSSAWRKLVQRFRRLGFDGPYSGGRHLFMVCDQHKIRIPNPHNGGEVDKSLLAEILRQAGIAVVEWEQAGK